VVEISGKMTQEPAMFDGKGHKPHAQCGKVKAFHILHGMLRMPVDTRSISA